MHVAEPSGFGVAEVWEVDQTCRADAPALQALLAAHGVVCVHLGQRLDKAEFEHLASLFGEIKDPVGRMRSGESHQYSKPLQHIDAGFIVSDEELRNDGARTYGGLDDRRPGLFETWHCDDTFTPEPARATVLHARALPPSGGGPTHFMDMRAAWDLLDAVWQREIRDLDVAYAYNNEGVFAGRAAASGSSDALECVTHPLVRTHPVAGTRALFMDLDRATHIEGLAAEKGRDMLQALQDFAEAHAPKAQHDWQDADVLIWDNASVQHKAEGNFPLGEPRRFWRHLIAGPAPE